MASGGTLPLRTGSYVGTGVAIEIEVGYRPKRVTLINATDPAKATWTDTMADGECLVETDTYAFESTNGVTPSDTGFTVGTLADVNTAGEIVHWVAEG